MDNRKLRQSATDDFMQSLAHLDELLGDTAEAIVLDDTTQGSDTNGLAAHRSKAASTPETNPNKRAFVNPDVDA